MPDALGDFDPQSTFDAASRDYAIAGRGYWEYLSHRLLDRVAPRTGDRVLDVPCGTGPAVIDAAERVGPTGHVTGIDYADGMLAIAREDVAARGLANVTLATGDMTALDKPAVPYDAITCSLGVFFVDDMPRLVRGFRGLLNPSGGRLGFAVFGEQFLDPMRDVFRAITEDVAPDVDVAQPWLRANTETALQEIFANSGFAFVGIETDDDTHPLPSPDVWWQVVMGSSLRRPRHHRSADALPLRHRPLTQTSTPPLGSRRTRPPLLGRHGLPNLVAVFVAPQPVQVSRLQIVVVPALPSEVDELRRAALREIVFVITLQTLGLAARGHLTTQSARGHRVA